MFRCAYKPAKVLYTNTDLTYKLRVKPSTVNSTLGLTKKKLPPVFLKRNYICLFICFALFFFFFKELCPGSAIETLFHPMKFQFNILPEQQQKSTAVHRYWSHSPTWGETTDTQGRSQNLHHFYPSMGLKLEVFGVFP